MYCSYIAFHVEAVWLESSVYFFVSCCNKDLRIGLQTTYLLWVSLMISLGEIPGNKIPECWGES